MYLNKNEKIAYKFLVKKGFTEIKRGWLIDFYAYKEKMYIEVKNLENNSLVFTPKQIRFFLKNKNSKVMVIGNKKVVDFDEFRWIKSKYNIIISKERIIFGCKKCFNLTSTTSKRFAEIHLCKKHREEENII